MARDGSSRPVRYEVSGVINEEAVIHRDDDDDKILIPAEDDDDEIRMQTLVERESDSHVATLEPVDTRG